MNKQAFAIRWQAEWPPHQGIGLSLASSLGSPLEIFQTPSFMHLQFQACQVLLVKILANENSADSSALLLYCYDIPMSPSRPAGYFGWIDRANHSAIKQERISKRAESPKDPAGDDKLAGSMDSAIK